MLDRFNSSMYEADDTDTGDNNEMDLLSVVADESCYSI
jgi:hypothetical protein